MWGGTRAERAASGEKKSSPRAVAALVVLAACGLLLPVRAAGQDFTLIGGNVRERADAVLALLGYSVVPDITASSLSINSPQSGNPNVRFIQFSGGFTPSQDFPVYLEGGVGFSRYDPTFIATKGQEQRAIPLKWNSLAATVGIGWDISPSRASSNSGRSPTSLSATWKAICRSLAR